MIINNLPRGYTQLDYIESDGEAYIDTGINADSNLNVHMDFALTQNVKNGNYFGAIKSVGGGAYMRHHIAITSDWKYYVGFTSNERQIDTSYNENKHHLEINVNEKEIKFDEKTFEISFSEVDLNLNYWLFKRNSNTANLQYGAKMKLYSCKMWDRTSLKRDYIPCINNDGVVGLFDLVSKTFFGSNDSNYFFVAGNIINRTIDIKKNNNSIIRVYQNSEVIYGLPVEYTKLDYIKATQKQYIDTEYKPNSNTRVIMNFALPELRNDNLPLFGTRNATTTNTFVVWLHAINGRAYPQYGNVSYDKNGWLRNSFEVNQKYILELDKNILKFAGQELNCQNFIFETSYNLLLLALNSGSSVDNRKLSACIYDCKIYENDKLIRNFIPCKNQNNICGLYDLVEGKFYRSVSNTDFEGGFETLNESEVS